MLRQRKPDAEVGRLTTRLHELGYTNRMIAAHLGVCERTLYRWGAGHTDIRFKDYQRLVGLLNAVELGRTSAPAARPRPRRSARRHDSWGELVESLS
jgi:hypothetical protein